MFDAINGIGGSSTLQGMQSMREMQALLGSQGKQKVKEEFLAIFYKELLKQSFKPPKLSIGNEDNSLTRTFGSDMLVERLALELARSGAFSTENLFPPEIGR